MRLRRGVSQVEEEVLAKLGSSPEGMSLHDTASNRQAQNAINRLIGTGVVGISTFTPTDAAHILGVDKRYPIDAAVIGGKLLARQLDRFGNPLAATELEIAASVLQRVRDQVAETILTAAADQDALSGIQLSEVLKAQRSQANLVVGQTALKSRVGVNGQVALVGAPAASLDPTIDGGWFIDSVIPEHHGVANAFGAAIGDIRLTHQITISAPRRITVLTLMNPRTLTIYKEQSNSQKKALTPDYGGRCNSLAPGHATSIMSGISSRQWS